MGKIAQWPEGWTVERKRGRWLVTWRVGAVDRLKHWFDTPPDRPPTPADVLASEMASMTAEAAYRRDLRQSLRPRKGGAA